MRFAALALLAATYVLTPTLHAQFVPSVGIHGYLNERLDLSSLGAEYADLTLEGRRGWNAGFDVRLRKKMLYVQPGLHYYSTTTTLTDLRQVDLPQRTHDERHTSVKLPIQAGLRLGLNGTAAVHLQGGPVATVGLQENRTLDLGGQRNLAVGVMGGVSVDLLRLHAHVRYERGLSPAFAYTDGGSDVVSVGFGVVF